MGKNCCRYRPPSDLLCHFEELASHSRSILSYSSNQYHLQFTHYKTTSLQLCPCFNDRRPCRSLCLPIRRTDSWYEAIDMQSVWCVLRKLARYRRGRNWVEVKNSGNHEHETVVIGSHWVKFSSCWLRIFCWNCAIVVPRFNVSTGFLANHQPCWTSICLLFTMESFTTLQKNIYHKRTKQNKNKIKI